jgi:hypothetical protein
MWLKTRSASFDEVRAHTFDRRCNVRASTVRSEAAKPRLASKETEKLYGRRLQLGIHLLYKKEKIDQRLAQ